MRRNKVFFLILIFSGIFIFQTNAQQHNKKIIDEVIWIVGDEAILKSDVENAILEYQVYGIPIEGDPYCVIPEQIAIQKLFLHQASLDSLSVNEATVASYADAELNKRIANAGSVEKLEEWTHKKVSQLREEYMGKIHEQFLVQQARESLVKNIQVTPADVRRYFSSMPADSIPTIPAEVELQVMSVNPPISIAEINRVKDQLRNFTERINADPSQFSFLAKLYSEDIESAKKGGEIGFSGKAELDPEYADVAFSLTDAKRVSRIVQSQYGYHIIQLIEKRGDKINTRHILLRPKISLDDKVTGTKALDSIANLIRENKLTFEKAVANFSQDKNTVMNAGLMTNPKTGTSKFEYQDLPSEIAKVVYDMNVGEVSKAFIMMDKLTNKEMLAIVKVKTKTPNHKANLVDDYQTLKNILENKKKDDFLNEWIAKKQKDTYISIDPEWRKCSFKYKGWVK